MARMKNHYGRMPLCGMISGYNDVEPAEVDFTPILMRRIGIQGFIVLDFAARFAEGSAQLARWILRGGSGCLNTERASISGALRV